MPARRVGVITAAAFLVASTAAAHPAIGIVVDGTGNVFYSDTRQVWRIAPDGTKHVAVPDVHTHELWVDAGGTLYGEHLWYEGDATGKWGHRVWKRTPDSRVSDVIPARPGFRDDYRDFFFARDAKGAMYWIERGTPAAIRTRAGDGPARTIAMLALEDPVWLAAAADGTVLLSDQGRVWRVAADGAVRQLPASLARSRDRFAVMGLAMTADGTVYAAVHGDRAVRRVTSAGEVTTVATTPVLWRPAGVAVGADGTVWVLEVSAINAQRVRRVDPRGRIRVFD